MAIIRAEEITEFSVSLYVGKSELDEVGFADSVAASQKTGSLANSDLYDEKRIFDLWAKSPDNVQLSFGDIGADQFGTTTNIELTFVSQDECTADVVGTVTWNATYTNYAGTSSAIYNLLNNNIGNVIEVKIKLLD